MTPQQKIKHLVLIRHEELGGDPDLILFAKALEADEIDKQFDALAEDYEHQDAMEEIRGGEVETSIKCGWSRHYESKSVASQYLDGSWVGWTYWYGGDKHGEPEAIDWIEDAYDLECVEEEKLVTGRSFVKPTEQPA